MNSPVAVHLSGRIQAEAEQILVFFRLAVLAVAVIAITHLAVPLHVVGILLEVCDADAEVVELIGELSSELVDHGLVSSGDVLLCHSLCDHLCHLIARDVLVALERRVAIALDDAVSSELGNSVIRPMVSRDIGERVRSSERRGCSADNESRRQCGYESLFHK